MTLLIGGAYQTVLIPGFFTLYANQILCDLIEETLAPYSKLVWILDKRQDILLGLIIVNRCKTGAEQVFQLDNIQRGFRFQETGLSESGLQMLKIDRSVHGEIEHIVIEIAAFDAILPGATENGMRLPGKQGRLIVQADLIGAGQ